MSVFIKVRVTQLACSREDSRGEKAKQQEAQAVPTARPPGNKINPTQNPSSNPNSLQQPYEITPTPTLTLVQSP